MTYDVVTFGESMLRLSPIGDLSIEQSTAFDIHVAGSESNTAVGLARLGAKVCWFSRVPNSSLGKLLVNRVREHGVDVSHVIESDDDRMGLYFVEDGIAPRPTQVIYDRADSAMSGIVDSDLPNTIFHAGASKLLHVTGITLAISKSAANTVLSAVKMVKQAGWKVSFDVNYRSKLWSSDEARTGCEPCLAQADIIFCPKRDAQLLFNFPETMSITDILTELHKRYPEATIVMSQGARGSMACSPNGYIISADAFEVAGTYRIGAGDAFSAGFLYSYIVQKETLESALSWGNAVAALKFSIPGDIPLVNKEHVQALLQKTSQQQIVR
ncbi:MAG: sugar kinase [Chloroflexota bacterium]